MNIRILFLLQLACIALCGAACRNELELSRWVVATVRLSYWPVMIGFPFLVVRELCLRGFPIWKFWMIASVEVALVYTMFLAFLPAFQ